MLLRQKLKSLKKKEEVLKYLISNVIKYESKAKFLLSTMCWSIIGCLAFSDFTWKHFLI